MGSSLIITSVFSYVSINVFLRKYNFGSPLKNLILICILPCVGEII